MAEINFSSVLHNQTKRDYLRRVVESDKAACATIARQWGYDYWDGDRQYGYGGMKYDGRWRKVAEAMVAHYGLKPGDRILDVGCGKGYLIYEFLQLVPGIEVAGLDISAYGIENAKEEVRPFLTLGDAARLPFPTASFDLVISLATLHNLPIEKLWSALEEIERVGRRDKWVMVESFRNEQEKANLLYWQLTCYSFHSPESWKWIFDRAGYRGDYGFIYFE